MNEEHLKRAMATCIHFNGVQNATCKAGMAYPKGQALPCIAPFSPKRVQTSCPKYQATTREQVEKEDADHNAFFQKIVIARKAIVATTKGERGVSGKMPCPVCKTGELGYSVSGYNGHIHAGCTTKDCVRWME